MSRVSGYGSQPQGGPPESRDQDGSMISLRQVVIIGLSILVGLCGGATAGIAAGLPVASAYSVGAGATVGFVAAVPAGLLAGMATAHYLHALIGRDSR